MRWLNTTVVLTLCVIARAPTPPEDAPLKVETAGVPNLIRLSDRIYQGAMPQGDAGFASLEKLGVKTVISVDGARPDLEDAHKHGIRYVHLPMGYDGMTRERALRVAKAVRDLPGPVYIHCHKGTVRGPTAAAIAHLFLDDTCTVEQALEGMKLAGFDRHYVSLWAAPKELKRPSAEELDKVFDAFLESAPPPGLTDFMVHVNATFENLQAIRKAEWKAPKDKPDLDPPHEALQLVQHFKELQRLPKTAERPEDFRAKLADAVDQAQQFEDVLRVPKETAVSAPNAEEAYKRMDAACLNCHAVYRDAPVKKKDH
jgi:protein tyrosine phosphatase (PTP) superfamily phosphohydrolase (DUF442 family)